MRRGGKARTLESWEVSALPDWCWDHTCVLRGEAAEKIKAPGTVMRRVDQRHGAAMLASGWLLTWKRGAVGTGLASRG